MWCVCSSECKALCVNIVCVFFWVQGPVCKCCVFLFSLGLQNSFPDVLWWWQVQRPSSTWSNGKDFSPLHITSVLSPYHFGVERDLLSKLLGFALYLGHSVTSWRSPSSLSLSTQAMMRTDKPNWTCFTFLVHKAKCLKSFLQFVARITMLFYCHGWPWLVELMN